jgi:hypothetical protein
MNTFEELHKIKMYLSLLQNIPNMAIYAATWQGLFVGYLALGAISNALYCQSRAEYYGEHAGGEWVRLVDAPVAELILVEAG